MPSEDRRPEATERGDTNGPVVGNMENAVTGVIAATGDLARMTIDEVSSVGEDLVHAVGRLGVATVSEIMNVVGSVTGSLGAAGSRMGRRSSRRDPEQQERERREREQRGDGGEATESTSGYQSTSV